MYHDVVIVIIPLHEPEATGRRRPLQVMELALARIGADEAVGLDHRTPKPTVGPRGAIRHIPPPP